MQLRHQQRFDAFFGSFGDAAADFDVIRIPAELWPHLYLLKVDGPRLTIRLTGDAIRQTFGRDLRGMDILQITHGPKSDAIKAGYGVALQEQRRVIMRRLVHFADKEITRVVECGFAPLMADGAVERIVGCIFFDYAHAKQADYGRTELDLERV